MARWQKLTNDAAVTVINVGVRNTNMTYAMKRVMTLDIGGGAAVTNISPIEFIRPEVALSVFARLAWVP